MTRSPLPCVAVTAGALGPLHTSPRLDPLLVLLRMVLLDVHLGMSGDAESPDLKLHDGNEHCQRSGCIMFCLLESVGSASREPSGVPLHSNRSSLFVRSIQQRLFTLI